jgi:DNA polymerase III delta prime subunit
MSKKKLSYTLFTEKYRPSSVADMLLPDKYKKFFLNLVKEGEVPNLLLFSSTPGSGKTSVAKAICDDIDADYLYINISSESGIDTLRTDIARFASGKNLSGKKKIVICDEFDGSTPKLQMAMRAAMEEFHNSCRFILTCNYVNKIIPALRSRLMEYDFNMNTKDIREEMLPKVQRRLKMVLQNESVEYKEDIVDQLAENLYPDIRKMYGTLQQYSKQNGIIDSNIFTFESVEDQFYDLILTKKFTMARQFMLDSGYSFDDMYSDLYHNLIPRIADKSKQAQIILVIAEWQYRASFSTDPEIPFAAMLVEIMSNL